MTPEQKRAIKKEGFPIPNLARIPEYVNGIIIKDGTVILCNGFNQHRYIYPFLHSLGVVDDSNWQDDRSAIHVSSNSLNGYVIHQMADNPTIVSEAQVNTLFALRKVLDGIYGTGESVGNPLYQRIANMEDHGGKYNGLAFLKRFYKNISLPEFSKDFKGIDRKHKICIRTSPVHSMPGLLNSKFDVTVKNYKTKVNEIVSDFSKHLNLIEGNEIHLFFQQQLNGINGVCNVRGRDRKFSYSASVNRGSVVGGKIGEVRLARSISAELKRIAVELAADMGRSIQLEFVVAESGKLFIVQFRLLSNEPEETVIINEPHRALCFGKTFSRGYVEVDVANILIVDEDGDSSLLLDKKALIVKKDIEFSHLLALSKALRIPSMYATGDIYFGGRTQVNFVAYNKKSWIV